MGERFEIIRCEAPGCEHLTLVWDREAEQVIDVLDAEEAAAYGMGDDL